MAHIDVLDKRIDLIMASINGFYISAKKSVRSVSGLNNLGRYLVVSGGDKGRLAVKCAFD